MTARSILVLLPAFALRCPAAAEEVKSLAGCQLVPAEWSDGDSFRVRLPDGTGQPVRIYGTDFMEWHVNSESDLLRVKGISPKALQAMTSSLRFTKAPASGDSRAAK
ncbi:MAG: hypothetical protein NTV93_06295 [Verrucomicrobia bacterium]|nr:hypothetical protein [Verrucomicrobiota bacterium]